VENEGGKQRLLPESKSIPENPKNKCVTYGPGWILLGWGLHCGYKKGGVFI